MEELGLGLKYWVWACLLFFHLKKATSLDINILTCLILIYQGKWKRTTLFTVVGAASSRLKPCAQFSKGCLNVNTQVTTERENISQIPRGKVKLRVKGETGKVSPLLFLPKEPFFSPVLILKYFKNHGLLLINWGISVSFLPKDVFSTVSTFCLRGENWHRDMCVPDSSENR